MPSVFDPEVYGDPVFEDLVIDPEVYGESPLAEGSALVSGSITADAVLLRAPSFGLTADAVLKGVGAGNFTADAAITSSHQASLTADAVVRATVSTSFTADAVLRVAVAASLIANAIVRRTTSSSLLADAVIKSTRSGSFTANAVIKRTQSNAATSNATIRRTAIGTFTVDAWIGVAPPQDNFTLDAVLILNQRDRFTANAVIKRDYSFTADAVIPPHIKANAVLKRITTGSVAADAFIRTPTGTQIRTFTAAAVVKAHPQSSFAGKAWIIGPPPVERNGTVSLDCWIVGSIFTFTADASIAAPSSGAGFFVADAVVSAIYRLRALTADAVVRAPQDGRITASAVISDRFFRMDAFIQPCLRADAVLRKVATGSFTTNARVAGHLTANAVVKRAQTVSFTADAIIARGAFTADAVVVRSRSFELPMSAFLKAAVVRSFSADAVIPSHFTMDAFVQPYFTMNAYIRSGEVRVFPPGGSPVPDPVYSRDFRIRITVGGTDVTGSTLWKETSFAQSARIAPGTFQLALRGSHGYEGGEELLVEIDDLLTYGGIVTVVEKGFFIVDAVDTPKTVLRGVDFNILFDKLTVYNKVYIHSLGDVDRGSYKPIPAWPPKTPDQKIIQKACRDWLDVPARLNFTDYVDEVGTANPSTSGTIETGVAWRVFMQEQSRMTNSLWWIDPYLNLHNHSRSTVTAPFPITDGDGGIGVRDLKITRDISQMVNDDIVWGTLARSVAGETVFTHQTADSSMHERYYSDAAARMQENVDFYEAIPENERTAFQIARLEIDRAGLAHDLERAAFYAANPDQDSVGVYGYWQRGEWRTDLHTQTHIAQRALAILLRYGQPLIRAFGTIFEPGYQAGQVVQVDSARYGISKTLVIRRLTLRILIGRDPVGGIYRGIPSYELEMGLDPEDPWDFYDALPFDEFNFGGFGISSPSFPAFEMPHPQFWAAGRTGGCGITDGFGRVTGNLDLGTADCGLPWALTGVNSPLIHCDGQKAQISLPYNNTSNGTTISGGIRGDVQPWDPTVRHSIKFMIQNLADRAIDFAEQLQVVFSPFHSTQPPVTIWIYPSDHTLFEQGVGPTPLAPAASQITWSGDVISGTEIPWQFFNNSSAIYTLSVYSEGDQLVAEISNGSTSYSVRTSQQPVYVDTVAFTFHHDTNLFYTGNAPWDVAITEIDVPEVTACTELDKFESFRRTEPTSWAGVWSQFFASGASARVLQDVGRLELDASGQMAQYTTNSDGPWTAGLFDLLTVLSPDFDDGTSRVRFTFYGSASGGDDSLFLADFQPTSVGVSTREGGVSVAFSNWDAHGQGWMFVRMQRDAGSALRLKVWNVGDSEPNDWTVEIDDPGDLNEAKADLFRVEGYNSGAGPSLVVFDYIDFPDPAIVTPGWGCEAVSVVGGEFLTTQRVTAGSLTVHFEGRMLAEHIDWEVVDGTWRRFRLLGGQTGSVMACYLNMVDQLRGQPSSAKRLMVGNLPGKVNLQFKDIHGV